ncbi:MAG TPA: hypothetical protein VFI46_17880 [Jiangellaceae bacterium]|nr:hypothetical protein [Jiangellaceae bacterium]
MFSVTTQNSDAGEPARPLESKAAALLTPEAAAEGFMVEAVGGRVRLFHDCGNVVRISEHMTDPQLRWYLGTHRCGPVGSEWHIGITPKPREWQPATSRAHLARSRWARRRGGPEGAA